MAQMAAEEVKHSRTIRIDLIPDVPNEQGTERPRRLVIAAQQSRRRAAGAPVETTFSGEKDAYRELLNSIYDAAILTNRTGQIVEVNERALDVLGYSRQQFLQLSVLDLISGADAALVETLWQNLEGQRLTVLQAYGVRRDNSLFPAEIAVNRLRLGTLHLGFFIRDITARHQAEEMLRTEHNALQNSGGGIAVADAAAALEYVNPAMAAMWGMDNVESLLDVSVPSLFSDEQAVREMLASVMTQFPTWSGILIARRLDGSEFNVQVSAARNRNSDGDTVGVVLSVVDVSDRLRAEKAEREAERHRVVWEILGAVTHHLGQPATVLLANLEVLNRPAAELGERERELVASSAQAIETLTTVLHRLNRVEGYRTTSYLVSDKPGETTGGDASRILQI